MNEFPMGEAESQIILYTTDDGKTKVSLMSRDGRVWLNQKQMAELFAVSKMNISLHIANILKDNELDRSVVKDYFTTAADGKQYKVIYYALEMILAVGYRVRGIRGTQFRQWDAEKPNMGLMTWSGGIVRKEDVIVAKNYLSADEVDTLNRITMLFLETAELRVKRKLALTLGFWKESVDGLLHSNQFEVLDGPGKVSHDRAVEVSDERYEQFADRRRKEEARLADESDLQELLRLEEELKRKGPNQ